MPEHQPVDDPVFGQATWDPKHKHWCFTLTLSSGRTVAGFVEPDDHELPLDTPEFDSSRACVRWIQANDVTIRQYVADKMYELMLDWHHEEWGPALSKDEFRDKLALSSVWVEQEDAASLLLDDAECFGGHRILCSLGPDGTLIEEPYLWG